MYWQLSSGQTVKIIDKTGCGHIDKSSSTDSDGRYHYGVHFRQESEAFFHYDDDGVPYTPNEDWARLDDMFVKVEPYNMNFKWTGAADKRPNTKNAIKGDCLNYDLSLSTAFVGVGMPIQFCEYWYPYWNSGEDFQYMQNEWRSETQRWRQLGVSFSVKRGGTNGGTYSFAFTNDVYYDLYDNGTQPRSNWKA